MMNGWFVLASGPLSLLDVVFVPAFKKSRVSELDDANIALRYRLLELDKGSKETILKITQASKVNYRSGTKFSQIQTKPALLLRNSIVPVESRKHHTCSGEF